LIDKGKVPPVLQSFRLSRFAEMRLVGEKVAAVSP
jgi:hypothetical protein